MLGKRLLVIEDDIDSLHAVSELLRQAGHQVLTAETGREGLRILHAGTPLDLVLLDFWLPDMTGHALLATRTRWPGALSLPVLLVTGDDAWVDEHRDLRQLGVVGLLRKPLDPELLLSAIEHAAASSTPSTPPIEPARMPSSRAPDAARSDTAISAGVARQARRLSDLLVRASELLAQSMDVSGQLRDITRLLVPNHADFCVIERADAGLSRQVLCVHHEQPSFEPQLRALAERSEGLGRIVTTVLESGEAQLHEQLDQRVLCELGYPEAEAKALLALGFESVVIVPMVARRRVFGTLICASSCGRRRYSRRTRHARARSCWRCSRAIFARRSAASSLPRRARSKLHPRTNPPPRSCATHAAWKGRSAICSTTHSSRLAACASSSAKRSSPIY